MVDLIERDKAKMAVRLGVLSAATIYGRTDEGMTARKEIERAIDELPSAQPEIIRCGECKWYGRTDKRRFYRGMDCLNKHIDTIIPDRDFCSRAERRTDETTI